MGQAIPFFENRNPLGQFRQLGTDEADLGPDSPDINEIPDHDAEQWQSAKEHRSGRSPRDHVVNYTPEPEEQPGRS
jgi:hypothetical protein